MEIRNKTIVGISWNVANQLFQTGSKVISNIILMRLLNPSDFGTLGMVTVFSGFSALILDFGFGSAIVQSKEINSDTLSTVFWLNMLAGIVLCLLQMAIAYPLAIFYGLPELQLVTISMGSLFVINAMYTLHAALFLKRMDMRTPFIINGISLMVSFGLAICMANKGFGVWSLVCQQVVYSVFSCFFYWILSDWHPSIVFTFSGVKKLLGFSANLIGYRALNYWARNSDNLIIGKVEGAIALGLYSKAYSFLLLPLTNITQVISKSLFPALSLIQDDKKRVKNVYLKITQTVAFVVFPSMVLLLVTANQIVVVLLGEKWMQIIPMLQFFAIIAFAQSILSLVGNIYLSQGRTDVMFRISVIISIVTIGFMCVGIYLGGIMGLVISYALATYLLFYPNFYFAGRLIDLSIFELFVKLRPILLLSFCTGLIIWLINSLLVSSLSPLYQLIVTCVAAMLFYIGGAFILKEETFLELSKIVAFRLRSIRSLHF
jgi:O-antigen/teichoic acid export membrane protein